MKLLLNWPSLVFSLPLLLLGFSSHADEPSPFKFEVHGIVGATLYEQSNPDLLLNGQGPLLERSQNNATTGGFDVRQTRLSFTVTGPELSFLGIAKPKAVIEADFFGLNSPGGYGEVSALQRLRLAYGELNWGNTWVRFGQDWELLSVNSPASLGHVAFPVTWFAGQIGWREPGMTVYHKFETGEGSSIEGAFQLIKSDWNNPYAFGSSTANDSNVDAGQLSGLPGVEGRVKWSNDHAMAYFAAHWNRVDGTRASAQVVNIPTANRTFDVAAGKIGGKYTASKVTLVGEAYYGKNTAPLVGEGAGFNDAADVHEGGGWLQAGYNFTPELSLWAVGGISRSNADDVRASAGKVFANTVYGGMLQYRTGAFGVGPEIYHVETKSLLASGANAPDGVMDGMQYMFSANYYF